MRFFVVILLACCAPLAWAQIYKYTDANGNTAYTNQPPDGRASETVELPPLNTVSPGAKPPPAPPVSAPTAPQAVYSQLALTGIPSEEALRANNGTFTVGVDLQPRLLQGHSFQLVLDGKPYGQPSNVPRLQLVNIDRGEHSLAVQITSGARVVQQSETLTFTVQRVHL